MNRDPVDINDVGYCMDIYEDAACADCFALWDCPGAASVMARAAKWAGGYSVYCLRRTITVKDAMEMYPTKGTD